MRPERQGRIKSRRDYYSKEVKFYPKSRAKLLKNFNLGRTGLEGESLTALW